MGGAAGDDLHRPGVLKTLEGAHQIAPVPIVEETAQVVEVLAVVPCEGSESRVAAGPVHFLVAELAERIEALRVPGHQELVAEHADERRRQRHRDPERDRVVDAAVEHLEQRKIRLGDRLVEPVLFQELGILGMPHVWEVGMKDDREGAVAHWSSPSRSGIMCVALQGSLPPGLEPNGPPTLDPLNGRGCSRRSQPAGAAPP